MRSFARLSLIAWRAAKHSVLGDFFAARLQDYACVDSVVKAVHALLLHHPVPPGVAETLLRACVLFASTTHVRACAHIAHALVDSVFEEVRVQSLTQPVRQRFFRLFQLMFEDRYVHTTRAMGADFVYGLIQALDGEKDPRLASSCLHCVCVAHTHREMRACTLSHCAVCPSLSTAAIFCSALHCSSASRPTTAAVCPTGSASPKTSLR